MKPESLKGTTIVLFQLIVTNMSIETEAYTDIHRSSSTDISHVTGCPAVSTTNNQLLQSGRVTGVDHRLRHANYNIIGLRLLSLKLPTIVDHNCYF